MATEEFLSTAHARGVEVTEPARASLPDAQSEPALPEAVQLSGLVTDCSALWFVRYRMRMIPRAPLILPLYGRGAILRGAFGVVLRQLVCHDVTLDCRACPLREECPYPLTFDSSPPLGGNRLSNFSDIPRPFVFDPPSDERTEFRPGQTVEFGLTTFGHASRFAPYFVTAFRKLADDGLGPRRARFDLVEVVALGRDTAVGRSERMTPVEIPIYKSTEAVLQIVAPVLRTRDLVRPNDSKLTRLTLRFPTPVDLRDRGVPVEAPQFGSLIRRLRDRSSALAVFFGGRPLELDFKGVSSLADTVRLVENRTRMIMVNRRSSRTGQRHDIGGFVGEAAYEGEAIGRLMPLVRAGEVMHVGKHAAFGNGKIEVVA